MDEAAARTALAEMTERLIRGPYAALGVPQGTAPDDVHAAFLQLTKRFHPARFGRMSNDLQQQANEVFLALRAAHDQLAPAVARGGRRSAAAPQAQPGATQTQPTRPIRTDGPRPIAARSNAIPQPQSPATQRTLPLPSTVRPPGAPPSPPPSGPVDVAAVHDLLRREEWPAAHAAIAALAAREPGSAPVRALAAYARGREAQLARRVDDARVELQDALALDPDLQLAKTALGELFTRRK